MRFFTRYRRKSSWPLKLTPHCEFCQGFWAALVCCRRRLVPEEYLPALLTLDDSDPPTLSPFADEEGGRSTVSVRRITAFGDAIWAVYNRRDTWRQLGPRVETERAAEAPGRNALRSCDSGKKFKQCCGQV